MIVAITGHTSGIGKALYDRLYPDVIGFSRKNGYDISIKADRQRIIDEAADSQIFINNAYSTHAQVDLLYAMAERWHNTDKLIINTGSVTADGIKNFKHPYAAWKTALDKAAQQLGRLPNACRISTIRPGYVETPMVERVKDKIKMPPEYMADIIEWIISNPGYCQLESITVFPREK
jgi:NAD(P)-dependent dehydrogenase (short-subunit alcohol dehydrogenase family)